MNEVIRYPDSEMPFSQEVPAEWIQFADLREELLIDYTYNTARAYWGDLDDWFLWAVERDKDVLSLSEEDQKQYYALLRRRKYSGNTIRRRRMVLGLLYRLRDATAHLPITHLSSLNSTFSVHQNCCLLYNYNNDIRHSAALSEAVWARG